MVSFVAIIALALLGLWAFALVDAIVADRARVRLLPKPAWVVVVALFGAPGALLWLAFGRPRGAAASAPVWRAPARRAQPEEDPATEPTRVRRLAPDDDPEFLRGLDRLIRGEGDR